MKRAGVALALSGTLLVSACRTSVESNPTPAPSAAESMDSAHAALDRMDSRTPVPLLPMMAEHQKRNMRDHLVAVQEITSAVALGDFVGVERAAQRLGSSQQMQRMCEHLGAHTPGFTELALSFHQTADTIVAASKQGDHAGVLSALQRTLTRCTTCHATYKQRIVTDAEWAKLERDR